MLRKCFGIMLLLIIGAIGGNAQELFPLNEPASSIPKGALGVRLFSQTFKEVIQYRNMSYLRLMYGVTPKLSLYAAAIASNHHGRKFPEEFPFHNTPELGAIYPYKFSGFWVYGKYRFLSLDGEKQHFRVAGYLEASKVNTTHHESEPDLEGGDNSGIGAGFIGTVLKNKFAASLTAGAILPFVNKGYSPDPVTSLPDVKIRVWYGKALTYHLSFGYRLLPLHYKNYRQGNLNLYVEFQGISFSAAKVNLFADSSREYYLPNNLYPPALQGTTVIDLSPGLQYILNSNLRIEGTVTTRLIGHSYARFYPLFSIGIQRYFFFNRKS